MEGVKVRLQIPEEPVELKRQAREILEESPAEGMRLIEEDGPLSRKLWEFWGEELEAAGMGYERFLQVARGYSREIRLWAVGERPWEHCAAGLTGRLLRRLPAEELEADRRE